jgi:NTP pyrophosphatase (non-canonical NTP hydrolase)
LIKSFNEYQEFTKSLAKYNVNIVLHTQDGLTWLPYLYPVLACAEEAGEVAGKLAKFVRKSLSEPVDSEQLRQDIKKELGDLQFQVSETARQFGFTLQEIVDGNVEKLTDRVERGVLIGEGDNR